MNSTPYVHVNPSPYYGWKSIWYTVNTGIGPNPYKRYVSLAQVFKDYPTATIRFPLDTPDFVRKRITRKYPDRVREVD